MDLKARADKAFTDVETALAGINRWMYDNPEIGFEEHNTSARLASFLAEHGFAVEYPAYGLETAFVARVGSGGPEVIICAEMDALPTVGHACGHNIIATSALGAGVALAPLANELGIRLTVLGTPAEEKMGGKVDLINAGAFTGAAASMMVHPSNSDVVDPNVLGVRHIDLEFHGKDSHAAFAPQLGINALDAFVQAYVNVSMLRQALYPTDKIHSIITHGGDAPNIIPSYTRSSWYVRAATRERMEELYDRVTACFESAATATGCTWNVETIGHPFEDMVSNPVMVELFAANAAALGRTMGRGADEEPGAAGSTDMGNVSQVVPSIHPFLTINPGDAVNHQPEFAAHTVTADGEQAIRDGALAMAWTVIDLAVADRWGEL
ncbi:MAG: M20 family metallopeptidase [Acidimicrobiia bacterium]|nr:M20 family metallopeptidase [Acidimicrobiia bacterium]MDH3398271.1 M20 family metallopeptidase [Acidimicrobiia bacterium]MDH5615358.1 M20 family metallopeptidase [Acidimicrobiia bacterium]